MTDTSLISINDKRWNGLLEKVEHEFYQLPQYVFNEANLRGFIPKGLYFKYDEVELIIPVLIRNLNQNYKSYSYDAKSPYGYPGFLSNKKLNEQEYIRLIDLLKKLLKKDKILTLFVHLNPFSSNYIEDLVSAGSQEFKLFKHGPIVNIPLVPEYEEVQSGFSSNHRRNIRKLIKLGYTARINDWDRWDEFKSIYQETMSRLSASDYYLFDDAYWDFLKSYFHANGLMCLIYDENGKVASAGIFTKTNTASFYHLGGTSIDHLKLAPSKLMFSEVIKLLISAECKNFLLGGGLGVKEDNLFKFKLGFGGNILNFMSVGIAADEIDYLDYCLLLKPELKDNPKQVETFFPYYRS